MRDGLGHSLSYELTASPAMSTATKPPVIERQLILLRDQRRKYGARVRFEVLTSKHFGELDNVSLLLPDGTIATIQPDEMAPWENGRRYVASLEGFATATAAEQAGHRIYQTLLAVALGQNFGMRFQYSTHEPPAVFDRTLSEGDRFSGYLTSVPAQDKFLDDLFVALKSPTVEQRVLLSMELFAAAQLEGSQRTQFVMAVSALEPLAHQEQLGPEASAVIDGLLDSFDAASVPTEIRVSLRGRIGDLKRESVRQAIKRLCKRWFEGESEAFLAIDRAYQLRSQLVHEGRLTDPDVLLGEELRVVSYYLRRIFELELKLKFSAVPFMG